MRFDSYFNVFALIVLALFLVVVNGAEVERRMYGPSYHPVRYHYVRVSPASSYHPSGYHIVRVRPVSLYHPVGYHPQSSFRMVRPRPAFHHYKRRDQG